MFGSGPLAEAIPMSDPGDVTQLLIAARDGERVALNRLFETVYEELHALAGRQLGSGRPGQTLGTTALLHEAYMKLVDGARVEFRDRGHFFALAARAMRQVVIDYARRSRALKRGGEMIHVALDPLLTANGDPPEAAAAELVALDAALTELEQLNERLARVVELRFFGGLSVEETGAVLDLSPRTVKRDWRKARAFLFRALGGASSL
ncbi:MAG TPA: sigma-70 family RNA polymerase sigma factor [Longimicrobiales bacterium]|nr:sigma-70 family RNA polymerase sigma factor [Longimicrobiales bacterium]